MNDCAAAVGPGTMIFLVLNSMCHQADRAVEWARRLRCLVIRTSHPSRAYWPAPFYLERGSTDHLERSTEKSSACAIAGDLLEQNILENERYIVQTKDGADGGKII